MEGFFAGPRKEVRGGVPFASRREARGESFEYVGVFYNRIRRHSSPGDVAPAAFESAQP